MKALITGAFGTVGVSILNRFIADGHQVSVFEIKSKANVRKARKYASQLAAVFFGDIRNSADVEKAIAGQDVIVHCAAIVPPLSDQNKKLCFEINVGGTQNVIDAIKKSAKPAPLIYISSASVMGPTQDREPPVKSQDPVNPTDNYTQSKVDAETLVQNSGIRFCILRLGAVMIKNLFHSFRQLLIAFEIPLRARCEVVLEDDVAAACVHSAEAMLRDNQIDGSVFFIGGGSRNGCQLTTLQMYEGIFKPLGVRVPPAYLFADNLNNYYIDWYDTERAEQMLRFQNHSFSEYGGILRKKYRFLIPIIFVLGPLIDLYIRSHSPYRKRKTG